MRNRLPLSLVLIVLGSLNAAEIRAQKVVLEIKAADPEITGLELAATRSEQEGCKTIAATEVRKSARNVTKMNSRR